MGCVVVGNSSASPLMPARVIRFLLLACFAFWASGAALYLHEHLEHGGGAEDETPLVVSAAGASAAPAPQDGHGRPHHHHDHDRCPVCQALASMKADRAPGPVLLESHAPFVTIVRLLRRRPPVVFSLPSAPIRGPPGLA